jgi:hypothetical protein
MTGGPDALQCASNRDAIELHASPRGTRSVVVVRGKLVKASSFPSVFKEWLCLNKKIPFLSGADGREARAR